MTSNTLLKEPCGTSVLRLQLVVSLCWRIMRPEAFQRNPESSSFKQLKENIHSLVQSTGGSSSSAQLVCGVMRACSVQDVAVSTV